MNGPVIITIDVLAVSGLDAWQARVFGDALETELARLVAAGGVPARITASGGLSSMALGGITVGADRPDRAGSAVARAIYQGLAE